MLRVTPQHSQQDEMDDAQEDMKGITPMTHSIDARMVGCRFDPLSIDVLVQSSRGFHKLVRFKQPFGLRMRCHGGRWMEGH